MKQAIALFFFFIISCNSINNEKSEKEVPAWKNNGMIYLSEDTLVSEFYFDTIKAIGPLKYGCYLYNSGQTYFGENVTLGKNETINNYLNRLKDAEILFFATCKECGDEDFYLSNKQNYDIINIYLLIKSNKLDSALNYTFLKSGKWKYSSRFTDLYIALLIKKYGKQAIEEEFVKQTKINGQDSIMIGRLWLHWSSIREYDNRIYKSQVNWLKYFNNISKRIEKNGI